MNIKNKKKTILQWILVIAIFFAFRFWQQEGLLNEDAPLLNSKTLTEEVISSVSNEPIVVHFWATWCVVCSFENANIQSISNDYKVLNIAMQSGSDADVTQYATENNMRLDNIINDSSGSLANIFGAKATPTSFFIFNNKIKFIEVGYTTTFGYKLRLWLSKWI
jgi:thiol-disulfide isomerase/thioredoxin